MKLQKAKPIFSLGQNGFSLVELMIAITLGFLVVGAVGYAYLGSRATFRTTDNMSRIQENARIALQTIAHDVRMAGYIGCGNLQSTTVNTIANPPAPALSTANAITGLDTGVGATAYGGITRSAGDVVTVIGAFSGGVSLYFTGSHTLTPASAAIMVQGNPYNFLMSDVLVVTNCTNADVFRVTNSPGGMSPVTLAHATSSNTGNRVGTYGDDAFVIKVEQYTYFIGTNPGGGKSLYRDSLTEGTVEIADNVQDMQIQYGIDPANTGAAANYITASAVTNWAQVVSARISLLLASQENVLAEPQTYIFNGSSVTSATTDRRMYRVFTTTVGVRNRLS